MPVAAGEQLACPDAVEVLLGGVGTSYTASEVELGCLDGLWQRKGIWGRGRRAARGEKRRSNVQQTWEQFRSQHMSLGRRGGEEQQQQPRRDRLNGGSRPLHGRTRLWAVQGRRRRTAGSRGTPESSGQPGAWTTVQQLGRDSKWRSGGEWLQKLRLVISKGMDRTNCWVWSLPRLRRRARGIS